MSGVLLISLLVALAVAAWLVAIQSFYSLRDDRPDRLEAVTEDGWSLAVWHRPPAVRRFEEPVILCHGLANNHAFLEFRAPQNLAQYLSDAGFDCYTVDLRGAGESKPPPFGPWDATVDDHVRFDVPAILEVVRARSGASNVIWLGHSLGGLVGLAASGGALAGRLRALVTIGSPVFFRLPKRVRWMIRLAQWLSPWGQFNATVVKVVAPFAGRVHTELASASANLRNMGAETQRFLVGNVFAPMWRGVLQQMEDWVTNDAFRSVDRTVDYRAAVAALKVPALVVGGTVDLLAPPDAMRDYFDSLTSEDRQLALFGRSYGHSAEYGHGDLVVGLKAHEEVYPVIREFLEKRATPTRESSSLSVELGTPFAQG